MCDSDVEGGILCDVARPAVVFVAVGRGAGVRVAAPAVAERAPGGRELMEAETCFGFGVMLWSADGSRDFFCIVEPGVLAGAILGSGIETSDIGGEGGSWISATSSLVEVAIVSGGVVIIGELAVEIGL